MVTQTHLDHIDARIKSKRAQIASTARGVAESMLVLAACAEAARHVSETPIQHAATALNTYCGELSALVEAREVLAHALG